MNNNDFIGGAVAGQQGTKWPSVAKLKRTCPVCGKRDNCSIKPDGTRVACGRVDSGPTFTGKVNNGGQYIHRVDGLVLPAVLPEPERSRKPISRGPATVAAECWRNDADGSKRRDLAVYLGVSVESLEALRIGWSARGWYSLPETDHKGRVVGIKRRWPSEKDKKYLAGSTHGLYLPKGADWRSRSGPVLLVEGESDTAALFDLGLVVVGLPMAGGGGDHVAALLADLPTDREVLVVAEDDRLKNGKPRDVPASHAADCPGCRRCWPGRAGALSLAERLATDLERQVKVVLPGDGAKDSREWKLAAGAGSPADLRERFLAGLVLVDVKSPLPVYLPSGLDQNAGPAVDLGVWRQSMVEQRIASLGSPAVYLDTSPPGAGKTHADITAIAAAGKGAVLVPTHGNAVEIVADFQSRGVPAVAYPGRRTKETEAGPVNCWSTFADRVQETGLPVVATVCPSCPYQDNCREKGGGYLAQLFEAGEAPVVIATHARGSFQGLSDLVGDRGYLAVHEDPSDLLRPVLAVDLADLRSVAECLEFGTTKDPFILGSNGKPGVDDLTHAALLLADRVCTRLVATLETAEKSGPVDLVERIELSGTFKRCLLHVMGRGRRSGFVGRIPGGGAWRLLLGAVDSVDRADVSVLVEKLPDGSTVRKLVAVWRRTVPGNCVTWFADGTSNAAGLEALLPGVKVIDATPAGRLPVRQRAVQVSVDLTRRAGESAKKTKSGRSPVLDLVAAVLGDNPDRSRVGIITHQPHVAELEQFRDQAGPLGSRIQRVEYFGSGAERSDNSWSKDCDLVLVLGTPRPGGAAVRQALLVAGEYEAAAVENPQWGPLVWRGLREDGEAVSVIGRGYQDPVWQAAYRSLVRSVLVQSIGRGRGLLETGVPVVVVSTEECGLMISDRGTDGSKLSAGCRAVLNKLTERPAADRDTTATKNQVGDLSRFTAHEIAEGLEGLNVRSVQRYLATLEARGLVLRFGAGPATRWGLVAAPESVEPCPAPVLDSVPEPVQVPVVAVVSPMVESAGVSRSLPPPIPPPFTAPAEPPPRGRRVVVGSDLQVPEPEPEDGRPYNWVLGRGEPVGWFRRGPEPGGESCSQS
jgi:hypothetical protein